MDSFRWSNPQARLLILTASLFIAWIGWLGYLAATSTRPVVLSRPQFLVSNLDVIAQVDQGKDGPDREVTVEEVHWPAKQNDSLNGKKITVVNLGQCTGWEGPGHYILPLRIKDKDTYEVATPGMSPGFEPIKPKPRIYRETPETLWQLNSIPKSE